LGSFKLFGTFLYLIFFKKKRKISWDFIWTQLGFAWGFGGLLAGFRNEEEEIVVEE
jgi:hypothetical protein